LHIKNIVLLALQAGASKTIVTAGAVIAKRAISALLAVLQMI